MSVSGTREVFFSFDFGTKRVGIAVGQIITKTASALATLPMYDGNPPWLELDALVRQWQPDAFIVGLPLNKDGSSHAITKLAKMFGKSLEVRYQTPVLYMDERLSSAEAELLLKEQKTPMDKADVDMLAAKLILESWFNLD